MSYRNDVSNAKVLKEFTISISKKILTGKITNLLKINKPIEIAAPVTLQTC